MVRQCSAGTAWPLPNSPIILLMLRQRELGFRVSAAQRRLADSVSLRQGFTETLPVPETSKTVYQLTFSPDGRLLAAGHGDHTVRVYAVAEGRLLYTLRGHRRTPWTLHFHPNYPHILASACLAGEVRVWDLRSSHCDCFYGSRQRAVVASLSFHPVEPLLAIASVNSVMFWDWTQHRCIASWRFTAMHSRVRWICFGPLGLTLYTGSCNRELDSCALPESNDSAPPAEIRAQYALLFDTFSRLTRNPAAGGMTTANYTSTKLDHHLDDEVQLVDGDGEHSQSLSQTATRSSTQPLSAPHPDAHDISLVNISAAMRVNTAEAEPDLGLFRSHLLGLEQSETHPALLGARQRISSVSAPLYSSLSGNG